MGDRTFPGGLEHLVLAVALRERGRGYGASLIRLIEERTGRPVQAGSVYVTLDRLEDKGWLESTVDEPDPARGGRPKRFVQVTAEGVRALAEHREALLSVWEGIEGLLEEGG